MGNHEHPCSYCGKDMRTGHEEEDCPKKPKVKVYITSYPGYTFSGVDEYGEPVYITEGYIDFTDFPRIQERLINFIKNASSNDYLLLSGANLLCALAFHSWLSIHGKCKVLHFAKQKYKVYEVG